MRKVASPAMILFTMQMLPDREWFALDIADYADLKSGTMYPALARLEADNVITSFWHQSGRRAYRLKGR